VEDKKSEGADTHEEKNQKAAKSVDDASVADKLDGVPPFADREEIKLATTSEPEEKHSKDDEEAPEARNQSGDAPPVSAGAESPGE